MTGHRWRQDINQTKTHVAKINKRQDNKEVSAIVLLAVMRAESLCL